MVKRNAIRPITPTRQRMIEDLTIRNLSATTRASYIHWVKSFALHIGRSPDQATIEDVRAYQLTRATNVVIDLIRAGKLDEAERAARDPQVR